MAVKEVGEICAGAKVEILPGLSSDHFLKVGGALEEQEQSRGREVGCVVYYIVIKSSYKRTQLNT